MKNCGKDTKLSTGIFRKCTTSNLGAIISIILKPSFVFKYTCLTKLFPVSFEKKDKFMLCCTEINLL